MMMWGFRSRYRYLAGGLDVVDVRSGFSQNLSGRAQRIG
jgi:hypothetical protein